MVPLMSVLFNKHNLLRSYIGFELGNLHEHKNTVTNFQALSGTYCKCLLLAVISNPSVEGK